MYINKKIRKDGWKEKTKKVRIVCYFIIFQILFAVLTMPFLIFYGPFENVKRSFVGTAMSTMRFQFLAKVFLSQNEIDELMWKIYPKDPTEEGEEIKNIKFKNDHSEKIELFQITGSKYKGNMLVIYDPTLVKLGSSSKLPFQGETTSAIAKSNGAIAAINAGGFIDDKYTGNGGSPMDFVFHKGELIQDSLKDTEGFESLKRDTACITKDGRLIVGKHSIEQLKKMDVMEGVSFGPPLVVNGNPTIKYGDGGWGIAPRTAIGQRDDGAILFLVIDGRSLASIGATLKEVQNIFLEYKAVNAVNLDGGSSTTMFYDGKIVNNPSDSLGERTVPNAFIVIPKGNIK